MEEGRSNFVLFTHSINRRLFSLVLCSNDDGDGAATACSLPRRYYLYQTNNAHQPWPRLISQLAIIVNIYLSFANLSNYRLYTQ